MSDRFIERVAEVAGQTVRRLRQHQAVLYEVGLTAEAADLEKVIREQETIVFDCMSDTDVIERHAMPTAENPNLPRPTDR